ncbi:MAG: heme exporter protein CcmD [Pseudomonadota bacterium]
MNWGSPAEFFAMGGYAFYVWGSFGLAAALMALEPLLLRHRRKAALTELRRELKAKQEASDEE